MSRVRTLKTPGKNSGPVVNDLEETQEELDHKTRLAKEAAMKQLISRAAKLDAVIKELTKELEVAKASLLDWSKAVDQTKIVSDDGCQFEVLPSSKTEISSIKEFVRLLKEQDKQDLLDDLLKVQLTKAKNILGSDVIEGISVMTTEKWGKTKLHAPISDLTKLKKEVLGGD